MKTKRDQVIEYLINVEKCIDLGNGKFQRTQNYPENNPFYFIGSHCSVRTGECKSRSINIVSIIAKRMLKNGVPIDLKHLF